MRVAALGPAPFAAPLPTLGVDCRRRHHQMDVGMKLQLARVRMQHRDGAGCAPQLFVVLAEGAHRLPGAAHEQIVDDALVRKDERPEFRGQGEGQEKVLGGDLLLQLPFQPLLTLIVLTVGAVAVAAGMRHQFLLRASRAFDLHHGAGLGAALFHRRQGSIVVGRESVPVLRQEVGLEGVDDGRQTDHLTCPQRMPKPSIRPLMRSRA